MRRRSCSVSVRATRGFEELVKNSEDHRLAIPLPKGRIRAYKADASSSQQLIGADWIGHTPKDEKKIKTGEAFEVGGERVQKAWRKITSRRSVET
jgi:hypothetical protein